MGWQAREIASVGINPTEASLTAQTTAKRPAKTSRTRSANLGLRVARRTTPVTTREAEADAILTRYSICRAEGHEWRHLGRGDNLRAAPRFYDCIPFVSSCHNCGTERTKWFNARGRSQGLEYRYPDNYAQRGESKLDRDDWGRLFIRNVLGSAA